ncbi:Hypothetical protein CINCED_3A010974 [Cinara cedri]|uniref:Type VII secretion system protein EssD-like domain-containing protein n=1 Tax=Cinara cedri TaxID=506608 RepID=A0A5E4MWT5_9HEMI|nr:Hypothetical protein CINCED_3A010974 [Cinara cedri]
MGNRHDQAGHIIADRLGGLATDQRNFFPQNPHLNMGLWSTIENDVYNLVLSSEPVLLSITLLYENQQATRLTTIVFRIQSDTGSYHNNIIEDISNPPAPEDELMKNILSSETRLSNKYG